MRRCQEVIRRVAGNLIQEKKRKIAEAEAEGKDYQGKDLLSLLRTYPLTAAHTVSDMFEPVVKSNAAADLAPEQRISDADILHNINTFMFAGSDTSSLAITWMLYLLARYPSIQSRLRSELLALAPPTTLSALTADEVGRLYARVADAPYLENVVRESLRLIPPVHSSARVATRDDVLPAGTPVRTRMPDGSVREVREVRVPKGAFIHVPVEGFNLDKEVWGSDAWAFKCVFVFGGLASGGLTCMRCRRPDRWDNLPEAVASQPGLYNNTLSFSAGPRVRISRISRTNPFMLFYLA